MTDAADKREAYLKRTFALAQAFLKETDVAVWEDAAELIDAVKKRAGLVLPGHDLDGKFYARLVSSRHMTNAQVTHLHDETVKHLSKVLGRDVNELLPPRGEQAGPLDDEPAKTPAGVVTEPKPELVAEFATKAIATLKDPRTTEKERIAVLEGMEAAWMEHLGPGYVPLVRTVIKHLVKVAKGELDEGPTLRYVDTHTRYWNPNPGRRS